MLSSTGVRALPVSVILALPVLADDVQRDPVERAVAMVRLQRAVIPLARSMPDALAGRVATEGFFLLLRTRADRKRDRRAQLRAVADRIVQLTAEHGARVRMGASAGAGDPEHLPQRYQEALVAAQQAMYEGRELVVCGDAGRFEQGAPSAIFCDALTEIRRALLSGQPAAARLDIDAAVSGVLARSRGSVHSARAYLESAFFDAVASLRHRGVLDGNVLDAMAGDFEAAIGRAPSAVAAASAFRDACVRLVAAVERPNEATAAERIGRATQLVDRAYVEPLTLARAAKEAGLSPAYFSRLFKRVEGVTFERRLLARRLERAKELLRATSLPMRRIARESGFNSYAYFANAFRKHAGSSATAYREGARR
jgi:AraC-like DNA-binding protein